MMVCNGTQHIRWIYTISVFRPFLSVFFTFFLLREKVWDFSSAFLYDRIRTNQFSEKKKDESFPKKNFVKGYSSIVKYRSYRSYTKFLNKVFMSI